MQYTKLIFPLVTDQDGLNYTLDIFQIENNVTYPLPNFMILSNDYTEFDINPIDAT
jgi:hypothetical protein